MRTLNEQLSTYALYHRDRRNIATHFVGVPMIVFGVFAFASRPALLVGGITLSPALLVLLGGTVFYLLMDRRFGLAMLAAITPPFAAGMWLATQGTGVWLGVAAGLFGVGWVIQFIGHIFEGKKPAFVDDLVGLLIGPLFVMAETAFMLGMRREVQEVIEAKAGPTHGGKRAGAGEASLQNTTA
jgi:uncharacterized membrane protein YGL010W